MISMKVRSFRFLLFAGSLLVLCVRFVKAEPAPESGESPSPIQATVASEKEGEAKTAFLTNTPKIYGRWQGSSLTAGDIIRAVWVAEAFGKEERDAKITEAEVKAQKASDGGIFSLARPEGGWPIGRYRLELYIDNKLATAVKFKVE